MPFYAYMTIDDGPSLDFSKKIDLLNKNHIPAVWFCQGNYLEKRPEMAIEAIQRGYVIGNHSYSHPSFEQISIDQGYAEIRATEAIIAELYQRAGVPQKHLYFRFPYGNKGDATLFHQPASPEKVEKRQAFQAYLRQRGYEPPPIDYRPHPQLKNVVNDIDWLWTFDSFDWGPSNLEIAPPAFKTPQQVLTAVQKWTLQEQAETLQEPVANMILMHDFSGTMAYDLFSDMVKLQLAKGIQFRSCAD